MNHHVLGILERARKEAPVWAFNGHTPALIINKAYEMQARDLPDDAPTEQDRLTAVRCLRPGHAGKRDHEAIEHVQAALDHWKEKNP